jgi:hypothetical protein
VALRPCDRPCGADDGAFANYASEEEGINDQSQFCYCCRAGDRSSLRSLPFARSPLFVCKENLHASRSDHGEEELGCADDKGKGVMARSSAQFRRLRSDFNLGGEQAEADSLLSDAFYESGPYRQIASRADKKCFLVGRTGSGKSALLQRLEEYVAPGHVIRISPEDLSLPYITDLGSIQYLAGLNVHLDPLFIALWKHVLLIEIIKNRYRVDTEDAKWAFLNMLRDRIKRDRSKQVALEYLEEFEGRFWCETDVRVRDITQKFENQIRAEAGSNFGPKSLNARLTAGGSKTTSQEERAELAQRFQRIVNETQLPRLNKMISVLDEDILESPQHYTYVVIDDLDRDWVDEKIANDLVRCLFRAVVDLKKVQNLKVLVALRTNIFENLDFGSRTGGQEEKFRSLIIHMKWTKYDLEEMVNARVYVAGQRHGINTISRAADLLPNPNRTRGNAFDFMLQHTLLRPRDLIAYFNECLLLAGGKERLSWDDIHLAEDAYSRKRLLALRDEWKPTYPGIDKVFQVFTGVSPEMDRREVTRRLDDAILLTADPDFQGVSWMTGLGAPVWSGTGLDDWVTMYGPLIKMLYGIGFLGFQAANAAQIYSYETPDYADRPSNIEKVGAFLIHPAYRLALDIPHGHPAAT